jgi:thiamine-phosphate pyrophosphorylase
MTSRRSKPRLGRGFYGIADVSVLRSRGLGLEEGLLALLASGAPIVQLRWKGAPAGELLEAARKLVSLCDAAGALSIVNDRVDVAIASGAGGVHLGQDDLPLASARGMLREGALIGVSTHDLRQVEQAVAAGADYIGFGPVFSTSTKDNPDPVVGIEGLRETVGLVSGRLPVVAIGGIDLSRVLTVARAGADLAAVISEVLGHPDAVARGRAVHAAMTAGGEE